MRAGTASGPYFRQHLRTELPTSRVSRRLRSRPTASSISVKCVKRYSYRLIKSVFVDCFPAKVYLPEVHARIRADEPNVKCAFVPDAYMHACMASDVALYNMFLPAPVSWLHSCRPCRMLDSTPRYRFAVLMSEHAYMCSAAAASGVRGFVQCAVIRKRCG